MLRINFEYLNIRMLLFEYYSNFIIRILFEYLSMNSIRILKYSYSIWILGYSCYIRQITEQLKYSNIGIPKNSTNSPSPRQDEPEFHRKLKEYYRMYKSNIEFGLPFFPRSLLLRRMIKHF